MVKNQKHKQPSENPQPVPVILMTGKGDVGKTSVTDATGLPCAELGYRTLVLSTDSRLTPLPIVVGGASVSETHRNNHS